MINSVLVLFELTSIPLIPAVTLILSPGIGLGNLMRLLQTVFAEASIKLTVAGMTTPAAVGVMVTAVTCTPTVPVTAPLKTESAATIKELLLLVPILTLPLAAKVLVLATVTEAPASVELKRVVFAVTVRLLLLATAPSTVLPLAVKVPAMVTSELAAIRALAVMGAALLAKVVTALTVRVCAAAELPMTMAPATVSP